MKTGVFSNVTLQRAWMNTSFIGHPLFLLSRLGWVKKIIDNKVKA
jgi:hypothetical protein